MPISKGNRPIDTSRLTKITKVRLGVQCGQLSRLPGPDPALVWGSDLTLSLHLQPGSIDSNNQLFAPGGRLSWGKGSSGGSGAKPADSGRQCGAGWVLFDGAGGGILSPVVPVPGEVPNSETPLFSRPASDSGRPATSTLNRFSALQQSTPAESLESRRVVQR